MKFTIKSILKTRSPLHIAHPDSLRMDDKGNRSYEGGFPVTAVQKMSVPLAEAEVRPAKEAADGTTLAPTERNSRAYPVIAANNIAGRMRRHASRHVLKALKAKRNLVSLHAYSVLVCGASTGKPDSDCLSYDEFKASRQHPYFGLLGGGPKMFRRNMRVHNSMPVTQELTKLKGDLAHPNAEEYAMSDKMSFARIWGFRRLDDLADLSGIDIAEGSIENFEVEFVKRQALILADSAAGKTARLSTKTYSAIEFVIPGVMFDLTMELDVLTDAQVGLYLVSLDSFAAEERLGGHVRNGFGVVTFENVTLIDENRVTLSIFNNGRLDRSIAEVAGWIKAWEDEAKTLDSVSLEKLIAVSKKEDKKAAKKAASEAEA